MNDGRLTPEEEAADAIGSYNDAVRAIGEQVKAGATVPAILQSTRGGLPADPRNVKVSQIGYDAVIEAAARLKDWPTLFTAVDAKLEEQADFVERWDASVGKRLHAHSKVNANQRSPLAKKQAEQDFGISQQQVSRWRKYLADAEAYRDQQILAAFRKAGLEPEANHRAKGTHDNEWFTPSQYIEAARDVMGEIDLDPASHPIAQQTVDAATYYTAADNGLVQPWHGRVWLNPPYVQPLISQFAAKMVEEVTARRVEQAIMLTHNYTDTGWFHEAERWADLICFTRGRIKFIDAHGDDCSPTQGQAFFYYGTSGERFRDVFSQFGFVR